MKRIALPLLLGTLLACGVPQVAADPVAAPPKVCSPTADRYVACGCGCCGGVALEKVCIEDTGLCLEDLVDQDGDAASNPGCAMAGCSLGVEYVRCTGL